MLLAVVLFFAGLLMLYYGAEFMVSGSSRLALSYGIRPLIIGMTIVAMATSMPEMMVTLFAVLRGSSDIAAGNIIGSNVANIGLILGTAALIAPLVVSKNTLWREIPIMIGASLLMFCFSLDGSLGFVDGLLLFMGLVAFLGYCFRCARERGLERPAPNEVVVQERAGRKKDILFILIGIVGLGLGAEMMVNSAVTIARYFQVPELIIGMSVVALGTSLPELAASVMSVWKGEIEICVGNVIGSNIFNVMFVLGICPMIRPIAIDPGTLRFEMPVMILFSALLIPLLCRRMRLGRPEGGFLLLGYIGFVATLFT